MANSLRVAFRVDASQAMGTGHMRRCLALSRAIKKCDAQTLFVSRHHDDISAPLMPIYERCQWLAPSPPPSLSGDTNQLPPHAAWGVVSWEEDAAQTIDVLIKTPLDWLVVDHYAWDARWHRRVAAALNVRLLVIDDLADRLIAADVLLDQNLHQDHRKKYKNCFDPEGSCVRFLTSPRYALLSEAYQHAPRYQFSKLVGSIGIFMGGTDPYDLSSKALVACRELAAFTGEVTLISSLHNPRYEQHVLLAARWPHTQVLHDLPDLSSFFSSRDLQIGTGGGAAWERCCIGAPTLAVVAALNQLAVLPQLAALGAVQWVELTHTESSLKDFGKAIADVVARPELRQQLSQESMRLVDGLGSDRVATVLTQSVSPSLTLRSAVPADEALLLGWFNDSQTRQNAFSQDLVSSQSHAQWFECRLTDKANCRLYIAYAANAMPLGMIRFDRDTLSESRSDADVCWLSYSIDVSFRGLRLARELIGQGLEMLVSDSGETCLVKALVKAGNIASRKSFAGLSFTETFVEHLGQTVSSFEKSVRSI